MGFYAPMSFLVDHYWIIGFVAAVLAVLAFGLQIGGRFFKIGAAIWIAYAAWEGAVQYLTPNANIRIDLLVIWPLLLLASILAIIGLVRGGR